MFPAGPIEVGQRWEQNCPVLGDAGTVRNVSVLEAAAIPYGKSHAAKINSTYAGRIDIGKMVLSIAESMAGGRINEEQRAVVSAMNGVLDINGSSATYWSTQLGKLMKTSGVFRMTMQMDMPPQAVQQGAPSRISMVMDMTMEITRTN